VADIVLERVRMEFPNGHVALAGLDLTIASGERLALVGPSGSGKSTVLRVIAGLERPTAGRVCVGGTDVTDAPPERRDLTMVFQSYALYPHMTVRANLGFGLRMQRRPPDEIRSRVETTADALGIRALLDRMPAQLSGGQRQRVALGRAIVRQPKAFLFDEPLSNLDPRLRGDVRAELIRLHDRLRATMIYVTHDQEEAMTLGQRIAVLRDGVLEQTGTPEELYARPANSFVATFLGSPPMNLVPGRMLGAREPQVTAGIRPHDLSLAPPDGDVPLRGVVDVVEPLGHARVVHVAVDADARLTIVTSADTPAPQPGVPVGVEVRHDRVHWFDRDGRRVD
jgi:ABC-type sugar transport system ATPase subunit